MTRYHAEQNHKTGRQTRMMMEDWKCYIVISTSCLRFSSRHSPRTPKNDPNANCNQQTDMNVKRETNDAKNSREHKHDRTSTGNHYHGFNTFQAKWFMAFPLCFFKLKWQENMKGSLKPKYFKDYEITSCCRTHNKPLHNILLIANWKNQSFWMRKFVAISLWEVARCTHSLSLQQGICRSCGKFHGPSKFTYGTEMFW